MHDLASLYRQSKITFIDGDKGELLYRGYPIEQLAEKMRVPRCGLSSEAWRSTECGAEEGIREHHQDAHDDPRADGASIKVSGATRTRWPGWSAWLSVVGVLPYEAKLRRPEATQHQYPHRRQALHAIVMALQTDGEPFMYPRNFSYTANFMHMMSVRYEKYEPNWCQACARHHIHFARRSRAECIDLDRASGLLAPTRMRAFRRVSAAVVGPADGGANEACLKMLKRLAMCRTPEYIKRAKDKNDSFKLMGFGHSVYKNFDLLLMRRTANAAGAGAGERPLVQAGAGAGADLCWKTITTEKKLYPNGLLFQTVEGYRTDLDVLHLHLRAGAYGGLDGAVGRTSGPELKIGRPRWLYIGTPRRDVPPVGQRW